jgi:putative transposase
VHGQLAQRGVRCGRKRVARLVAEQGLVGVHARRRWRRGRPGDAHTPDLVGRQFNPSGPDQLWAADVTQFWTPQGWLHLAAVLDLWSRRVIGWSMGNSATAELVSDALLIRLQSSALRVAAGVGIVTARLRAEGHVGTISRRK